MDVTPTTQYFDRTLIPASGASLSGTQILDAEAGDGPGVSQVAFELTGGTLSSSVIATGTPTIFGWLAEWSSTAVPNGTYTLQSVATDHSSNVSASTGITVTVDNPPPSTTVGLPANGATVKGSQWLDASASPGVTKVVYELTGGTLHQAVIGTATPTSVGWLAYFTSTSVANGSYTLESVASYAGGVSGTSAPVTINVAIAPGCRRPAQLGLQGVGSNEGGGAVVGVVAAGVEVAALAGGAVVVVSGGGCCG